MMFKIGDRVKVTIEIDKGDIGTIQAASGDGYDWLVKMDKYANPVRYSEYELVPIYSVVKEGYKIKDVTIDYRLMMLKPNARFDNARAYDLYEEVWLKYPDSLNYILGQIAVRLNARYGQNKWYLSEAGQFIHVDSCGGDRPLAYITD